MELMSLVIMGLGLLALVAIFLIARFSQREAVPKRDMPITPIKDDQGNEMSTILEDNAALDGKEPASQPLGFDDGVLDRQYQAVPTAATMSAGQLDAFVEVGEPEQDGAVAPDDKPKDENMASQLILFIAAQEGDRFVGKTVIAALEGAGLQFGDMDIYHRMVLSATGEISLFSVANGIAPWTLNPEAMRVSTTPGLSMILNLPCPQGVNDSEAIHDFIRTAERVSDQLGGVMKDHNQNLFTPEVRDQVLQYLSAA